MYQILEPTSETIENMIQEIDPNEKGEIDLPTFLSYMSRKAKRDEATKDNLVDNFKVFGDADAGMISVDEFKRIMTTMGEQLTEEV